jgi:hypothetical protein
MSLYDILGAHIAYYFPDDDDSNNNNYNYNNNHIINDDDNDNIDIAAIYYEDNNIDDGDNGDKFIFTTTITVDNKKEKGWWWYCVNLIHKYIDKNDCNVENLVYFINDNVITNEYNLHNIVVQFDCVTNNYFMYPPKTCHICSKCLGVDCKHYKLFMFEFVNFLNKQHKQSIECVYFCVNTNK